MNLRKMRAYWPGLAKGVGEWVRNRGAGETKRFQAGAGGYVRTRHVNLGMFREADVGFLGPRVRPEIQKAEW